MYWMALVEKLFSSRSSHNSNNESVIIESLDLVRLLRSAGSALFAQTALHSQLARVEWEEEKNRLLNMFAFMLFGFACGLCIMTFVGILVIAFSWNTPYQLHAIIGLLLVYSIGMGIAWHKFRMLSALSNQAFSATREEIAADLALLKSKL